MGYGSGDGGTDGLSVADGLSVGMRVGAGGNAVEALVGVAVGDALQPVTAVTNKTSIKSTGKRDA